MPIVAKLIRSSADWYEEFVDEKDLDQHYVGQEWIEHNYEKRSFYLGYIGDDPVGTISLQDFGDYLYIGYLYLDAKQVGKKLGHRLMSFAFDLARMIGKQGLVLIAHPEAIWATRAYLKFGFQLESNNKDDILGWNDGVLEEYHEEGFELYVCDAKRQKYQPSSSYVLGTGILQPVVSV